MRPSRETSGREEEDTGGKESSSWRLRLIFEDDVQRVDDTGTVGERGQRSELNLGWLLACLHVTKDGLERTAVS